MAAITEYLIPESGKSAEEAAADVLAILGHRDLVRALRARPMNDCVPSAGMQIHEALNVTWETLDAGWLPAEDPAGQRRSRWLADHR